MLLDKFSLEGQVCIVTGGGRGLGRVFCLAFAEAGADVAVAEVDPKTGVAVADEIRALGRRALFVETDVRCRETAGDLEGFARHRARIAFASIHRGWR